jgi:hypothetical protein
MLTLEDGYDLRVGGIREDIGPGMRRFWAWCCHGSMGEAETREAAMEAFRVAWEKVTADEIAKIRHEEGWTAAKYAFWNAGKRKEFGDGAVHCFCGETFHPRDPVALKFHAYHVPSR